MNGAGEPVARLAGVTHRYGRNTALDDITLDLPAGRVVGFIGPDGVGKSTLLALIAGARAIQSGTVHALGGDMRDDAHRRRVCPGIAYMPQGLGSNLYQTLSVLENVDFFGRLFGLSHAQRAARIDELLAGTGLAPFRDRAAGNLSGGMKQKLGLCCALIHDPELLILDEPTTGVDPLSRRQFWELVATLRQRRTGMSVLVATAYMEEASVFDELVIMDGGRILAADTPANLRERSGESELEHVFVQLLPADRRRQHHALVVPPRTGTSTTATSTTVAIEAHDLTRRFGDFTAVDAVSFRIERGEIFGFVGSNGCGKTTTMKMLTGLLPATSGSAELLGHPVSADDLATRKRVGYMSQGFSLYSELTVEQNLDLHARLFHVPDDAISPRVSEMLERFELTDVRSQLPDRLPLGMRQRLSLAVAVIHRPELLILDEPTSGVDPIARDRFWELMIDLARRDNATIFISTHFMNEAQRCDRIALMHAGRVLAEGTPAALIAARQAANLEEAFIAHLQEAEPADSGTYLQAPAASGATTATGGGNRSLSRMLSYARRELLELMRDPIRLTFALAGTALLMLILGYGMSMDVENLPFAVLDRDDTPASREYAQQYSGSRYFHLRPPVVNYTELDRRMRTAELSLVIEIPPGFGRDLKRGRPVEIGVWVDGAMPFRGETIAGYVQLLHNGYLTALARDEGMKAAAPPAILEVRYRYNPQVKSINAMVPAVIPLLLMLIPAMLTALGVVREKELGSIVNLYVTPVTRLEFLLGKQLPYVGLAMVNFFALVALAVTVFGVPHKGSLLPLTAAALLYVLSSTGLGLLMSAFARTQVAALFGTAFATMLPAVQFSGLITPVSSLEGAAAVVGHIYPTTYFLVMSRGTFAKALGFADLQTQFACLAAFIPAILLLSLLLLRKQGR